MHWPQELKVAVDPLAEAQGAARTGGSGEGFDASRPGLLGRMDDEWRILNRAWLGMPAHWKTTMKLRLNLATAPPQQKRPFLAGAGLAGTLGLLALLLLSYAAFSSWRVEPRASRRY